MSQESDNPHQEALVVASERTGQTYARDLFGPPGEAAAVNLIERNLHIMNCLSYLAAASMRPELRTIDQNTMIDRQGRVVSAVVLWAAREGEELMRKARWAFAYGTGLYELTDTQLMSENKARALTRGLFTDFKRKYYGMHNHQAAFAYSQQLSRQVEDLRAAVSAFNREHGLRPHQTGMDEPDGINAEEAEAFKSLASRDRLRAILDDPRAGFLPATNTEKNVVLTFLDYFDNPEFPLGINNQLLEILVHGQKNVRDTQTGAIVRRGSLEEGRRGAESKTWEIGDFLADAARSYRLLSALQAETAEVSPTVTLAEELGVEHEAIPLLLRYRDIRTYMEKGAVAGLDRIPLRTGEERWAPKGPAPGKHKRLHGPYTRPDRTAAFDKYIKGQAAKLTFGEIRSTLNEAIGNEVNRSAFMLDCLHDILNIEGRSLEPIREAVQVSLGAVKHEPVLAIITHEPRRAA